MEQKTEVSLDQNVIKEVLYEIYQKGNQNRTLLAKQVIQEMIEKLQPFISKKPL